MLELLPRSLPGFHRAVDKLRALGHFEFGRVAFQVVSAGRGDCSRGAKNSRAGNRSFFNGLLDFDVAVARAFRLHVPNRGKALLQGTPRRISSACGPQCDSCLQNILVVAALFGVLAPQENMCVRID